jgi:hypothetical protein
MQRKHVFIISIMVFMLLAACGPTPEPTPSILEIQDTAVAMALTSVAMTKAVLPTNTPIPTQIPTLAETPTPFPTMPPLVSPTSPVAAVPTNTQTNPCNEPPPIDPKGTTVQVRFINKSKGKVNLAFGMLQENEEGECGTYNFIIGPRTSPEFTVLAGCYWAWAPITGTENSIAKSPYDICLTDTNQTRGVTITKETIGFD